jgi:hypothetical protein
MGTHQNVEDGRIDFPDVEVSVDASVPPDRIYATLIDLSTHTTWSGTMLGKHHGLRSLEAPGSPATVGTEFHSTGADPLGSFTDRSIVTEATPSSAFEFVTEGHLARKKPTQPACETRITNRYEIAPDGSGSTITFRAHVTRWTNPPMPLRARALRPLIRMAMKADAKKTLRNLATFASKDLRAA